MNSEWPSPTASPGNLSSPVTVILSPGNISSITLQVPVEDSVSEIKYILYINKYQMRCIWWVFVGQRLEKQSKCNKLQHKSILKCSILQPFSKHLQEIIWVVFITHSYQRLTLCKEFRHGCAGCTPGSCTSSGQTGSAHEVQTMDGRRK